MPDTADVSKLHKVLHESLLHLHQLTQGDTAEQLRTFSLFLIGLMSTAADLFDMDAPGSASMLYAEVEAAAKQGGLKAIHAHQASTGANTSVSMIADDDMTGAMNYLGQCLSAALFKGLHELPMSLRQPETILRSLEALLCNLLRQQFDTPHQILDSFAEHVHMALDDVASRAH